MVPLAFIQLLLYISYVEIRPSKKKSMGINNYQIKSHDKYVSLWFLLMTTAIGIIYHNI